MRFFTWKTLKFDSKSKSFNGSGNEIGYYGYMYSLVFAADMYATVFKKDPLDPTLGEKYKNSILVPGGSREELDSLKVRCATSWLITRSKLMV